MGTESGLGKSVFSPAYGEFLALLRKAREGAGLSQEKAARKLGKPQSFVSKCESGERRVDVVELIEFCRVYGIRATEVVRELERFSRNPGGGQKSGNTGGATKRPE
jgi:ribosome-binding protein aMBF1 (putative translation factor)